MGELIIARAAFQLGNQFVSAATYLYSAAFFLLFVKKTIRGEVRFTRFEVIALCYFVLSIGISLVNSSASSVVSQFNKLFLCLLLFKIGSEGVVATDSKAYSIAVLSVAFVSVFVIANLFVGSSYSNEWGTKTFLMSFKSQHETASLIVLLISALGFDLNAMRHKNKVLGAGEIALMTGLMYALLMTGARTITVCGTAIYALYLFRLSSRFDERTRPFLVALIVLVAALMVVPHLSSTVFFEKNGNLSSSSSFSNGREDIWGYYKNFYLDQPLLNQIFGSGVGLIMERSMLSIGAHNDILTFLLSYGVIGLALYYGFILRAIWSKGSPCLSGLLAACFLFCSLLNGFVGYTELICAMVLVMFMRNMQLGSHARRGKKEYRPNWREC